MIIKILNKRYVIFERVDKILSFESVLLKVTDDLKTSKILELNSKIERDNESYKSIFISSQVLSKLLNQVTNIKDHMHKQLKKNKVKIKWLEKNNEYSRHCWFDLYIRSNRIISENLSLNKQIKVLESKIEESLNLASGDLIDDEAQVRSMIDLIIEDSIKGE